MSILARAPLRAARIAAPAARQQVQVRALHVDNVVGKTLPTSVNNKAWLAVKMATYATLGFGTPFFGCWFQLSKASG